MLSNKLLVATCAIAFCCNVALLVLFVKYNTGERCFITINEDQDVLSILPKDFISFGIDTSEIEEHKIDFTRKRFQQLASELAPARLRLGGTMSDRLIFSSDDIPDVSCKHCPHDTHKSLCSAVKSLCKHVRPFFFITGSQWTEINNFCKAAKIKLLFSLNVLLRDNRDNSWNDANAKDLLDYSRQNHFDIDWQLGNEPNSFPHVFNITITPQMLAHDFKKLRKLLNHHGYKNSLLVGPDTTRPQPARPNCLEYMVDFLANASNYINIRSWHQYYLNSRTADLEDFWNPDTFDLLNEQIDTMKIHTEMYNYIPMWLTETSSSYGGGAPGLSNTYAGTALWLDKLGLAAKNNITTVIRQSFYGGYYSLVDSDLEPLPDWWVTVLYKRLVGQKVLSLDCNCSRFQRMYVHCANKNYTNDTSAITIYAVNLEMNTIPFLLNGTALKGDDLTIDEYIFSARSNNRRTKTILLNNWPLYYESSLPNLEPHVLRYGNHISMPPYSVGFWVVKNTSISVCK